MKITKIETILAGVRYLFVKVHTDSGLVGLGECGAWCYQEATARGNSRHGTPPDWPGPDAD